jgi:hypothetical protein
MVTHLYPDFLRSDVVYRQAASFWRHVLEDVASSHGQLGEWLPWRPETYVDNSAIPHDVRPIADARSARLSRAVTLLQHEPTESTIEIAAWIEVRGPEDDKASRTEDLTINLALSEESLVVARRLIDHWMDPSISRERIQDLIQASLSSND